MDRDWDTEFFKQEDLKKTVTHAHVSVRKNNGNKGKNGAPPFNHWSVFFETSPSHSVCFNMVLNNDKSDETRGIVLTSTRECTFDREALHTLSFPIKGTPTVEDVANFVNRNGLHRFRFSTDGQGCRFWVCTFISHLEKEGIVEYGCADQTWADAAYYYIDPSGRELRKLKEGTFVTSTESSHSRSSRSELTFLSSLSQILALVTDSADPPSVFTKTQPAILTSRQLLAPITSSRVESAPVDKAVNDPVNNTLGASLNRVTV
ncbi:hypothetical protein E4U40_004092 [Claviceps sp. LM458 group G5]|nr:hypothetical protein E4U40_004092 [Claviceps sp. LM458 group G5]